MGYVSLDSSVITTFGAHRLMRTPAKRGVHKTNWTVTSEGAATEGGPYRYYFFEITTLWKVGGKA